MALYVNGKQISGGGGGNTNSVELTYAEYQALTPEQQLDGTEYFITDINGDGQQFQPICYSEEEREIGVWIDGKPLYQLTCVGNAVTAGQSGAVDLTDYSIDTFVGVDSGGSMFIRADYVVGYTLNGNELQDSQWGITVYGTSSEVRVNTRQFGLTSWFVTIHYTKTTDTAGSGTWTPQGIPAHHYSTDEQVVGTWIDGSTLYEKTLIFNNVEVTQSDSTSELVHDVSNIGSFKRVVEAYVDFSGGQNWIPAINAVTPSSSNDYTIQWEVGDNAIVLKNRQGISLDASVNRSYLFTIQYTKSST